MPLPLLLAAAPWIATAAGGAGVVGAGINAAQNAQNPITPVNAAKVNGSSFVDGLTPNIPVLDFGDPSSPSSPAYTGGYSSGGGGGTSAASANRAQINQYNEVADQYQRAIDRLPSQLDISLSNIGQQYNTNRNELNSSRAAQENAYNTSTTQNQQNLRSNKNTIADQQSSGLRGLMRTLGAYGAVGSDLGVAGQAVADAASLQRAGAGQTFAQNQQGLDTNWNNYLGEFANQERKLNDWRGNQERFARQENLRNKQSLLQQLADARGQATALGGGSFLAGARPIIGQAEALQGEIDSLGRVVDQQYTGNTPTYQAAPLGSYLAGALGQTQTQVAPTAQNSPYLAQLLGQDRRRNNTLF